MTASHLTDPELNDAAGPWTRPVAVIGAATSAGAYGPGQEAAPHALRGAGLLDVLARAGRPVKDLGDVVHEPWRADPEHPDAANVDVVARVARAVAAVVSPALERGENVLVLGGDCTVELGTVAGSLALPSTTGLVYIDLDGDLNTPATGDGVLDWMGLAHLLDLPGSRPELAGLGSHRPMLQPHQVRLVGVDRLTDAERDTVSRLRLTCHDRDDVVRRPEEVILSLVAWAKRFDRVLLHIDVDVLDFATFPIAHETRLVPALQLSELSGLTHALRRLTPNLRATTVCEVNPAHAARPEQLRELAEVLAQAI